ncbi:MAG: molybdenum cofactor biosynthesis protein MoaE [Acidimicrobiales bacterium]
MRPPSVGDDWLELTGDALVAETALGWVTPPDCGATVLFSGTVRDHAEGRPGVSELAYEAYAEHVVPRMACIVAETRRRHQGLGRIVVWHRIGSLAVGECSVLVAVSAAHRGAAFSAAEWTIDRVKSGVPIWKRETWAGGQDWAVEGKEIMEAGEILEVGT